MPTEIEEVPFSDDIMLVIDHRDNSPVHVIDHRDNSPVQVKDIERWTSHEPILSAVRHQIMSGSPNPDHGLDFKPYTTRKTQLSCQAGCVLWGARVIIPPPGRVKLLKQLNDTHPGMVRMKMLARSYF